MHDPQLSLPHAPSIRLRHALVRYPGFRGPVTLHPRYM